MASRLMLAGLALAAAFALAGCSATSVKFTSTGPVLPPREGAVDILSEEPEGCIVLGSLTARSEGPVSRSSLVRRLQSAAAQHGADAVVLLEEKSERVSGMAAGTYGGYLGHRDNREVDALAIKR